MAQRLEPTDAWMLVLALIMALTMFGTLPDGVAAQGAASVAGAEGGAEAAPEPTLEAARGRLRAQDPAAAQAILEQVVKRQPEEAAVWFWLGISRYQQQDFAGALDAQLRSKKLGTGQAGDRAALQAARALGQLKRTDEALKMLESLRGKLDLSQTPIDPSFAALQGNARFEALLPTAAEFADSFVEKTRILGEWHGEAAGDAYGWIAREIGDVDGDGVRDFTTSAPNKDLGGTNAGRVYTYSSKSGKLLWQADGAPGDLLGQGIEAAGDVNGDGRGDVLAGAPGGDYAVVWSGIDGVELLRLKASQAGEGFGRHAADLGDLNGDGHDDVFIGAPRNDKVGEDAGRAAVYSGKDGALLFEVFGERAGDRFGEALAGRRQGQHLFLMVGAPDAGKRNGGKVYLYTDTKGRPSRVFEAEVSGQEFGGMFLSVVGDLDADDVLDLYVSDWNDGLQGAGAGRIYVYSGRTGKSLLTIAGESAGDGFGIGPADAGDLDGDGHADLVVGAWQHASAAPSGGKVYVFSGRDGSLQREITSKVPGDTFGFDATGIGDVDGDGAIDFLLTSAWSPVAGPRSGRVLIIAGQP